MEKGNRGVRWSRILICVLGLLSLLILSVILLPPLNFVYHLWFTSAVTVSNRSGADVRFEKVMIDDQIIWDRSEIIIKTSRPNVDRHGGSIPKEFKAR